MQMAKHWRMNEVSKVTQQRGYLFNRHRVVYISSIHRTQNKGKMGFLGFLFSSSPQPTKLVLHLEANLNILEDPVSGPDAIVKCLTKISKDISSISKILSTELNTDPGKLLKLSKELHTNHILIKLIRNIGKLLFESQKTVGHIFVHLLGLQVGQEKPTVDYISKHPELLFMLMAGYSRHEVCYLYGPLLLECINYESLARIVLYSAQFDILFDLVESMSFEIASSALIAIKTILTKCGHSKLVSQFLETHYEKIIGIFTTKLMVSKNYYTKRESIKMFGEIILEKSNILVLQRFISSASNLKILMKLLKDSSARVQYEAFHVFKAFFVYTKKELGVYKILVANKYKLIEFLTHFGEERGDEQLLEDKYFIIKEIEQLNIVSTYSGEFRN